MEILNVIGWKIKEYWIFMFERITEKMGVGVGLFLGISIYCIQLCIYAYNMNNLFLIFIYFKTSYTFFFF